MNQQDFTDEQRHTDLQDIATQKRYERPQLQVYGSVSSLTQGGAGTMNEGQSTMNVITLQMTVGSDRRIKTGVIRIDQHPIGIGLYLFDYLPEYRETCGYGRQFGVIAQEVEQVMPAAVIKHPSGYKMVDYGMLGISRHPR
ncbi:tail fiber domain-containing protein [Cyanobium sp. ATX 6A2]|uniref:tail fiber domain-containing protein n=1 Tax=Cyanobium sp. ATX 6A2 TaxID=2823700 RepID=UPI0020CF5EBD|nr:tail fiber domain-containing protein [Cyanobium sp. ATX 6A2]MCP9888684.1 tail fiber domain-containing protein [Cyanobium sp. ATX 6A2]